MGNSRANSHDFRYNQPQYPRVEAETNNRS